MKYALREYIHLDFCDGRYGIVDLQTLLLRPLAESFQKFHSPEDLMKIEIDVALWMKIRRVT